MLVQIDGSHHRWLGDNGSQIALLLALGGATSAAANAVFCPEEDTLEYFTLLRGLNEGWGLSLALYGDSYGAFNSPASTDTSSGQRKPLISAGPWRNWASSQG